MLDRQLHVPAAVLAVNQLTLLDLAKKSRGNKGLHHTGRFEMLVLIDADQLFASGEIIHRPGGALVVLDLAFPAQAADVVIDGSLDFEDLATAFGFRHLVSGNLRHADRSERHLPGVTVVEHLPILRAHRAGRFQTPGLQQSGMSFRDPCRPGAVAMTRVDQTEQIALCNHLETAGHSRPQHPGDPVAVVLDAGETPRPEIGNVATIRRGRSRRHRRQSQQGGDDSKKGAPNGSQHVASLAGDHLLFVT
ncbi:MAG: hypothetical protein A2559_02400 [Deltaproteobacteria bacterium RIFOXYD2_FULL_66_9]|nr:MAG: hypothetical protein A2559_02400 [Deltaproteobacteria bacterium RIFOXYD2_FULL_66_9]